MMDFQLKWVESNGGPLLFLSKKLLEYWKGASNWSPTNSYSDYDRACTITDYAGILPVAHGYGLVLGEEPMSTAWYPLSANEGWFVRWRYAPNEQTILNYLQNLQTLEFLNHFNFFVESPMILFDSASSYTDIQNQILVSSQYTTINLLDGRYKVGTLAYNPSPDTALILHHLKHQKE